MNLFGIGKRELPKKSECHHERWTVSQDDLIGFGTCKECGESVNISVLLNNLGDKLMVLIKRAEKVLEGK